MSTVLDIVGRVAKKADLLRNDGARAYTILKIMKLVHDELPIVAPHIVREEKTAVSDALSITGTAPIAGSKVGAIGTVDISNVLVGGVAKKIIEIHSVVNSTITAPYKRVKGLEHIANLGISDESGAVGRYWWVAKDSKLIYTYRGSEVAETAIVLGFVSAFDTSYTELSNLDLLDSLTFDCPAQLESYMVVQTAMRVLEDLRMQMPEHLGQEVQDQKGIIQNADANMAAQIAAMERQGADSLR